MSVLIGSARSDEYGRITGGRAGDQTGNEVSTQNWYLHSKGWVIIRAKNSETREKIAYAMERACANKHIGYDQNQRNTAYNWCYSHKNYDPGAINTDVEIDCSALVRLCCIYAGITIYDFTTSNEVTVLNGTGKFTIIANKSITSTSAYLMRGDILVTAKKGHTVVVLSNGSKITNTVTNTTKTSSTSTTTTTSTISNAQIGIAKAKANMNVRSAANTSSKILGLIEKGNCVPVVKLLSNGWMQIEYIAGNKIVSGYASNVSDKFFTFEKFGEEKEYKTSSALNIRKGPGTEYLAMGTLPKNTTIKAKIANGWAKLSDGKGYSSSKYLKNI